jgi:hypothetical protein
MSKFILKKDWILKYTILDKQGQELLYTKGKIFEPNEHGEYVISSTQGKMILKYKDMKSAVDGEDLHTPVPLSQTWLSGLSLVF